MEQYLKLAKEDLETAQLLYKCKKYSNALYHYHQSVEKASKFIGLSSGGISEKQLTSISHEPIRVFKFLFNHIEEQSGGILPQVDPHLFTNAKKIIDLESEEEIVRSAWNLLTTIINEVKAIDEEQFPTHFDAIVDYISKTIPSVNMGLDNKLFKQYAAMRLKDESTKIIVFINFGVKILQILLVNSLICSKFRPDQFRYPTNNLGNPVEYFNEGNPIIRDLQYFMNSMNISIEFAPKINWNQGSF